MGNSHWQTATRAAAAAMCPRQTMPLFQRRIMMNRVRQPGEHRVAGAGRTADLDRYRRDAITAIVEYRQRPVFAPGDDHLRSVLLENLAARLIQLCGRLSVCGRQAPRVHAHSA